MRSLRAEWNNQNTLFSLRKGFQVVYLFDSMKTRELWTNCQGVEPQIWTEEKTLSGRVLVVTAVKNTQHNFPWKQNQNRLLQ